MLIGIAADIGTRTLAGIPRGRRPGGTTQRRKQSWERNANGSHRRCGIPVADAMTTRPAPKPDPWDFETLLTIDKRIDTREDENIRDRWEFGRVMLAARADKKRLPSGYLAALIERTGKSQSELSYRLRCAEVYPTEAELSNALELFPSWHELVQNLYEPVPSWTKEEIARFV